MNTTQDNFCTIYGEKSGGAHRAAADAYMLSARNSDLPATVRQWLANGEGAGQDVIELIEVREWKERSGFEFFAAPHCFCCQSGLSEGHIPARVRLAESETCHAFDEEIELCAECGVEFGIAGAIVAERPTEKSAITAARDAVAAIPATNETAQARAKALGILDDMIDAQAVAS